MYTPSTNSAKYGRYENVVIQSLTKPQRAFGKVYSIQECEQRPVRLYAYIPRSDSLASSRKLSCYGTRFTHTHFRLYVLFKEGMLHDDAPSIIKNNSLFLEVRQKDSLR